MEVCPKCGLPIPACICQEIGKEEQKIKVQLVKRKFGKFITIVTGFQDIDVKPILKELKKTLACGGTIKNEAVELQGDHKSRVRPVLIKLGFNDESIED